MTKIIVIEENSAEQNLLVKHLQTAGCEVVDLGNHPVNNLLDKIKNVNYSEFAMTKSIFPTIPKLEEVFQFIELNYSTLR